MRWAIAVLLVINLVVFLWGSFRPTENLAKAEVPQPDIGNLRLLSERDIRSTKEPESAVPSSPDPVSDLGAVVQRANVPDPQVKQPLAPVVEKPIQPEPVIKQVEPEPPASAPDVMARESEPLDAEPKAKNEVAQDASQPDAKAVVTSVVPEIVKRCWQVGNYERRSQAVVTSSRLPGGVELLGIGEGTRQRPIGYYVMIPPAADKGKTKVTVSQLHKAGIRDTWVFPSGPYKNGISLGLFSREAGAHTLAKQTKKKGFNAVVKPKTKSTERFWIEVKAADKPIYQRLVKRIAPVDPVEMDCP